MYLMGPWEGASLNVPYQWTFYRGECQHLSKEVYLTNHTPFQFAAREEDGIIANCLEYRSVFSIFLLGDHNE